MRSVFTWPVLGIGAVMAVNFGLIIFLGHAGLPLAIPILFAGLAGLSPKLWSHAKALLIGLGLAMVVGLSCASILNPAHRYLIVFVDLGVSVLAYAASTALDTSDSEKIETMSLFFLQFGAALLVKAFHDLDSLILAVSVISLVASWQCIAAARDFRQLRLA